MRDADAQVSCTLLPFATGHATNLENTWPEACTLSTQQVYKAVYGVTNDAAGPELATQLMAVFSAADRHLNCTAQPGSTEQILGQGKGHSFVLTQPQRRTASWTSRSRWLTAVSAALATADGDKARNGNVSVRTVTAVAKAMAEAADHRTGDHCALSRRTIAHRAGCSVRAVGYARRVLETLQLAVEIARGRHLTRLERIAALQHHGRRQIRAASNWALTLTKHSAQYLRATPRDQDTCTPPRQGLADHFLSGNHSLPSSKNRAEYKSTQKKRRSTPPQPSLEAHKLTAKILKRAPQLWNGHRAGLARLLEQYLDPTVWSCSALFWLFDAHTSRQGWQSPQTYENPQGWWRWKLTQCQDPLMHGPPSGLVYS